MATVTVTLENNILSSSSFPLIVHDPQIYPETFWRVLTPGWKLMDTIYLILTVHWYRCGSFANWINNLKLHQMKLETKSSNESALFHFTFLLVVWCYLNEWQTSNPVKWDTYQSWISSSLHAEYSHSVAVVSGPVTRQDGSQNFPRGVKPSGWRVTVYNAGFSPFHALILSIVPELSQLNIQKASKDHVTLPHPLFANLAAFPPPPCSTVFFLNFKTHCAQNLVAHSISLHHCLSSYTLTAVMISHCKQRVYYIWIDLVSPWCWLFSLWESPWWIEISVMPAMCFCRETTRHSKH